MRKNDHNTQRRPRHVPGQKPRGCFQERVKKVGPEHFAIIPVDCGKPEARTRVADFYGNVLLEPFSFDITRAGLDTACCRIQQTIRQHHIQDWVCVIETTGRYHLPIRETFKKQQWDTRDVHPYTSSLLRRSADLGTKTDDVDLAALHRAAVDGLAMRPEVLDPASQQWRLLVRHRRDLVEKCVILKNQLKETFHAYLPGYARLWDDDHFWDSPVAATIATAFDSPRAMQQAPDERFRQVVRDAQSVIQKKTIDRIRAWTHQAGPCDDAYQLLHRRACSLWTDLRVKWREIEAFELELADFLCHNPCVLLLAFPGINVISASDYGAELGPISNYATSKSIAGRAGLYPSRHQSSQTDCQNGRLVVRRNRQLRAALMRLARCLNASNHYFMGLAQEYQKRQPNCDAKVPIARSFSRLSYYVIASQMLPAHAAIQNQEKVLQKLLEFYQKRQANPEKTTAAVTATIGRLPATVLRGERSVLAAHHCAVQNKRRTRRVMRIGEILPQVLLRIDQRLQEQTKSETSEVLTEAIHEDRTHGS